MESINFDYFADRAVLLTEMARTASLPGVKYPEIVQAYGNARKIGKQIGGITSMDDFSYGYMAYIIDDFLTPEQQRQYDTTTNVNAKIPLVKSLLIDVLNKNPDKVGEIASQMSSEDNVRQYHQIYKSTKGQSGRSKGAKTIISDVGGIDPDDLTALENELAPYLKQMNKVMQGRNISKAKGGFSGELPDISNDETVTPDEYNRIQYADFIIYCIETLIEAHRTKMKDYGSNLGPITSRFINYKGAIKDLEGIKALYKSKIDKGIGSSPDDFEKDLRRIENYQGVTDDMKSVLTALSIMVEDLSDIIAENQFEKLLDISRSTEEKLGGYDKDVINHFLKDEDIKNKFMELMQIKGKLLQNKIQKNLQEQADTGIDIFWAKRGTTDQEQSDSFQDKRVDVLGNLKSKKEKYEKPYGEGVEHYLCEQVIKDTKFKSNPNHAYVDRGFKKFKNYNHWMTENE